MDGIPVVDPSAGGAAALARIRESAADHILLLSPGARPEPGMAEALLARMRREEAAGTPLAAAEPLILRAPFASGPPRAVFAGMAVDRLGRPHSLHEGLPADHPLLSPEACARRRFLAGLGEILLARRDILLAAGPWNDRLGPLAPLEFCIRLAATARAPLAVEAAARGMTDDPFLAWRRMALWNALVLRGRLNAPLEPDVAALAAADGCRLILDDWLADIVLPPGESAEAADDPDAFWAAWRRSGDPRLLRLLPILPRDVAAEALRLCREIPGLLPSSFRALQARAERLEAFARASRTFGNAALLADLHARRQEEARFARRILRPAMGALERMGIYACSLDAAPDAFDAWLELHEASHAAAHPVPRMEVGREWPEIAVIMPVWNPRPDDLRAAVDSVRAQKYGRWRLRMADDASSLSGTADLLRSLAADEPRISLRFRDRNGHISRASNSALEQAEEPWMALMDQDDLLAPEALLRVAAAAADGARFTYSDEDHLSPCGVRRTPHCKSGFDPLFLLGEHYICHLTACETDLARRAGGFRSAFDGAQDYDLVLRITELLDEREIRHLPHLLYHWRVHPGSTAGDVAAKPYVAQASLLAVRAALRRRGWRGCAIDEVATRHNILWLPPRGRRHSVILLSPGGAAPNGTMIWALERLMRRSAELLIQPVGADAIPSPSARLAALSPRVLPARVDTAAALNAAAAAATGEVLVFLDARLAPSPGTRPEQLPALAIRPDCAVAGGDIWCGGRLLEAGLQPDAGGLAFPSLRGTDRRRSWDVGWMRLALARRCLGAPTACMALRREILLDLGGFDASFGPWMAADFALRAERAGLHAQMASWNHWEAATADAAGAWPVCWPAPGDDAAFGAHADAARRFREAWGETVRAHPLRNASLGAAPDYGWMLRGDG